MYAQALMQSSGADFSLFPVKQHPVEWPQTTTLSGSYMTTDKDSLTISMEAMQKNRISTILSMASAAGSNTGTKTLAEVGQDLQENLADFKNLLDNVFSATGINPKHSLTLQSDGKGNVKVQNEGNNARKVNNLFSGNSILVSRFMVIAARSSILEAADSEPGFKDDYEKDAPQAIRTHIDALKDRMLNFQMTL